MDIVAADILLGLPVTEGGLRYILVLTDYFTKWACAFALPDAKASTFMRTMYDGFFSQFGLPNHLHTNQERNLECKLFHEMCQLTGVVKARTTPFHPQTEGKTERMNRTLLQMLRCTADEHPEQTSHSYGCLSHDCASSDWSNAKYGYAWPGGSVASMINRTTTNGTN